MISSSILPTFLSLYVTLPSCLGLSVHSCRSPPSLVPRDVTVGNGTRGGKRWKGERLTDRPEDTIRNTKKPTIKSMKNPRSWFMSLVSLPTSLHSLPFTSWGEWKERIRTDMNRASDKEWESDMRWWDTRRKEWTTNRVSHVTLYPCGLSLTVPSHSLHSIPPSATTPSETPAGPGLRRSDG